MQTIADVRLLVTGMDDAALKALLGDASVDLAGLTERSELEAKGVEAVQKKSEISAEQAAAEDAAEEARLARARVTRLQARIGGSARAAR